MKKVTRIFSGVDRVKLMKCVFETFNITDKEIRQDFLKNHLNEVSLMEIEGKLELVMTKPLTIKICEIVVDNNPTKERIEYLKRLRN